MEGLLSDALDSVLFFTQFFFQWSPMNKDDPDAMDHNNVICYALLVVSFVMAWIETWFLDFQVLPIEYKERQKRECMELNFILSSDIFMLCQIYLNIL